MIYCDEEKKIFHLQTNNSSYIIRVLPSGHLGQVFYGGILDLNQPIDHLILAHQIEVGSQVAYDETDPHFSLNLAFLEMPTFGKGDFREPMLHLRYHDGSSISDFKYLKHEITEKKVFQEMPEAKAYKQEIESLIVTLRDDVMQVEVDLHYAVFMQADVIARRAVIRNTSSKAFVLERALSMNFDMHAKDYLVTSFDGAWIRERMLHRHHLVQGLLKLDAKKGVSSADHNPFFMVAEDAANEKFGNCFGFGLIYSGSFEANIERSPHDLLRVQMGINSFDFSWPLQPQEQFVTPEVVMSFSSQGLNQLSQNVHHLIKQHIIKPDWQDKSRPVLFNNWEATMFDFTQRKLWKLAKKAKKLGIETFVLDDGWFGTRDDDTQGLGDWKVNRKKLPMGLKKLAEKINRLGMNFGLWVEPEMVNPNSELYHEHPDWVIKHPKRFASMGRHQLVLDLTKTAVRDYLVNLLTELFQAANISYVKWDMNRNLTDLYSDTLDHQSQGQLQHLYQLGLYDILERLTTRFPDILFEACASGGNRFDMGMLYYMPQIWTSDNTDGYTRQWLQQGTSYAYPPSVMGAHVSDSPSAQVLRKTPLETRFNISLFGLLGYELDITQLTPFETKVIQKQIHFYKRYRDLIQSGDFYRLSSTMSENTLVFAICSKDRRRCLLGLFRGLETPNPGFEKIDLYMLNKEMTYRLHMRTQYENLDKFGYLIKHALPIKLNDAGIAFGLLKNRYLYPVEKDERLISGDQLVHQGFIPKQNFLGTGINDQVRLMGDFGSRLYYFEATEETYEKNISSE